MRFRAPRRSFSRKGTREQLIWLRQDITNVITTAFGTQLQVTLFNPATLLGGAGLDERYTVRRIRGRLNWAVTYTAGGAAAIFWTYGVELIGAQEIAADPNLAAAADQQADWLELQATSATVALPAAARAVSNEGNGITGTKQGIGVLDIRTMRKVNNDQAIVAVINDKRVDPAADAAPTRSRFAIDAHVSVLFQRTRR